MSSQLVKEAIRSAKVVVFSKTYCPYCTSTKQLLKAANIPFVLMELDTRPDGGDIQAALAELSGQRTVPNIFINGKHLGGNSDLEEAQRSGKLRKLLNTAE